MRQPKGQVRREREHVQHLVIGPATADFGYTPRCCLQVRKIDLGEEEWRRLRASACRKRDENRSKLSLETFLYRFLPVQNRPADGAWSPRQNLLIGDKDEISESLRLVRGGDQVRFTGERNPLQIVQASERISLETMLREKL